MRWYQGEGILPHLMLGAVTFFFCTAQKNQKPYLVKAFGFFEMKNGKTYCNIRSRVTLSPHNHIPIKLSCPTTILSVLGESLIYYKSSMFFYVRAVLNVLQIACFFDVGEIICTQSAEKKENPRHQKSAPTEVNAQKNTNSDCRQTILNNMQISLQRF